MFKSCLRPLFSGAMLGLMLAFPQNSLSAALHALDLFASAVLPVLFPFTACMLLFTAGRAFPLPALLLLSLLGGSPAGARLLCEAGLSPLQARRAARMTGTISPMFFLGTLSLWLDSPPAARLVLCCHLAAALLLSLPLLPALRSARVPLPVLSVGAVLQQSASAMLTAGGCILLGSVGAQLLACLLPCLPALPLALLKCLMEVTAGCKSLISLRPACLLPLLCAFTSFNGLSLLMQNAAFWGRKGISLADLAFFGLLRAGIAFLLCFVILLCHPGVFAL